MTQDTAVKLMIDLDIRPNPLISAEACHDIAKALERMWQVGYEEAQLVQRAERPVSKFSKSGELIESYRSISNAARRHKVSRECISCAISGKQKTAAGFIWRYAETG